MRHLIVGTAGHIDHGKSALVQALTGIDPDRLKEEKQRGITIDLGFADLDLGSGRILSFVDVPGHERFVRHMVAGATGVDAVLLIVAADEGVRPQTREHLAICSLLEIGSGIVVLTKADLVDPEILEVVELEVREFTRGSFLEEAPLVAVSARTGSGVTGLLGALGDLFERIPERAGGGIARLPIDRSFVLHGFGTVVTGTLVSGTLREGEEVEVLPGRRKARIRGLQVHRERVPSARAGQRTAVNLQGIDRDEAPRGATLAAAGTLPTTRRIWARVRLLPGAPASLRKGGAVRFHQGTCERAARLRLLAEGDSGELIAEILLREETVLLPRDRFILRRPAPMDTVGGGLVLDVRPPLGRAHARRAALVAGDPDADLLVRLERAGCAGRDAKEVASELGFSAAELERSVAHLVEIGRLVRAGGWLFHAEVWSGLERECIEQLRGFHQQDPLRRGMSREELRSRLCPAMAQEVWREFLERLSAESRIRLEGELLAEASFDVQLSEQDLEVSEAIERRFREAGLDPPDAAQVTSSDAGARAERILELLIARGRLVRLRDGRLVHADPLAALREKLREHAQVSRTIDVATFKRLADVTRKNAIPLLEYLDAARITRRVGDLREILVP